MTKVEIEARIMYRYVQTVVKSTMRNTFTQSQEVTFAMVLPEPAFISNFSIITGGREHVASVMDQTEARETYEEAKKIELSTGLIEVVLFTLP